jgi:hypothetical protein
MTWWGRCSRARRELGRSRNWERSREWERSSEWSAGRADALGAPARLRGSGLWLDEADEGADHSLKVSEHLGLEGPDPAERLRRYSPCYAHVGDSPSSRQARKPTSSHRHHDQRQLATHDATHASRIPAPTRAPPSSSSSSTPTPSSSSSSTPTPSSSTTPCSTPPPSSNRSPPPPHPPEPCGSGLPPPAPVYIRSPIQLLSSERSTYCRMPPCW